MTEADWLPQLPVIGWVGAGNRWRSDSQQYFRACTAVAGCTPLERLGARMDACAVPGVGIGCTDRAVNSRKSPDQMSIGAGQGMFGSGL